MNYLVVVVAVLSNRDK